MRLWFNGILYYVERPPVDRRMPFRMEESKAPFPYRENLTLRPARAGEGEVLGRRSQNADLARMDRGDSLALTLAVTPEKPSSNLPVNCDA